MATIFEIDKQTFVSGLLWQPLSGVATNYRKETTKLAKEMKFDLAVWRTTSALQVGFGSSSEGLKPGLLSAAAGISKSIEVESGARDFLCVAEVGQGKWLYVAQRQGVILPDGDIVGGEDEIKTRFLEDRSLGQWAIIYAPSHWGLSGITDDRSFNSFLPKKDGKNIYKKWWRLRQVDQLGSLVANPLKTLSVVVMILVIGFAGQYGYKTWQKKKAMDAARAAEALAIAEGRPTLIEHPWKKEPRARVYLKSCMTAMNQVKSLWPGNWAPIEAACVNGVFTVSWKRGEWGWIDHLRAVEPQAILSPDGSVASLTIPLEISPGVEDEAIQPENSRILDMQGTAQRYRFSVVLQSSPAPTPMPGQENANAPQQGWKEMKWEAKGIILPPDVVLGALDGAGFRLSKVNAIFNGGLIIWNMEGSQYVKP